jgi:hypothetical protein
VDSSLLLLLLFDSPPAAVDGEVPSDADGDTLLLGGDGCSALILLLDLAVIRYDFHGVLVLLDSYH